MSERGNDLTSAPDTALRQCVGRIAALVFILGGAITLVLMLSSAGSGRVLLEGATLAVVLPAPIYLLAVKPYAANLQQTCALLRAELDERVMRTTEMERYTGDLEMRVSLIEEQAHQNVELAEELAQQKSELEYSKRESDYLASHDMLTGLHNRRAMRRHLSEVIDFARDTDTQVAVMFIDIDKFKLINDVLGHDRGDEVLTEAARALIATVRDTDLVARWGGDEFAIVTRLSAASDLTRLGNLAERIRAALDFPVEAPNGPIEVRGTIGIAIYPNDADEVDRLLACADQAMYVGKKRGRNVVVLHGELSADPAVPA